VWLGPKDLGILVTYEWTKWRMNSRHEWIPMKSWQAWQVQMSLALAFHWWIISETLLNHYWNRQMLQVCCKGSLESASNQIHLMYRDDVTWTSNLRQKQEWYSTKDRTG
jgi:hypothetical protein